MSITILGNERRGVGDPNPQYNSLKNVYERNRAALSGERYVKDLDSVVGTDNLLIPFSVNMTQDQYNWYKSEAEWPGITEQYARTIVGGLLRKMPEIDIDENVEFDREEALDWLRNHFSRENQSIVSFLDDALWEEMNTSRAWVCVNYPVTNPDDFTPEELQPYPILLAGESIINWDTSINPRSNKNEITRLVVRMFRSRPSEESPYHSDYIDTVWVHQLDDQGYYEIIVYERSKQASAGTEVIAGRIRQDYPNYSSSQWTEVERETNILRNGERLDYIPIFPLNGNVEPVEPFLSNLISREFGLYNRISRRNHLLYGSASYTPVVSAHGLTDDQRDEIVDSGLGSWLFVGGEDSINILSAPTDALQDLDRAIDQTVDEMARLGIRILSPETNSNQSGIALEIRNAAQTAQLATLNHKISEQMTQIIRTMIEWRYNVELNAEDIHFNLSSDFNPAPIGADWIRLVSDLYRDGTLPKSVLIDVLRNNDVIPADYDDMTGQEEIDNDENIIQARERFNVETQAIPGDN